MCPDIALLGGGRYMAASVEVRVTKSLLWLYIGLHLLSYLYMNMR